jgi:hypothetical protein
MQARDNIDFTFLSPTPRAEHPGRRAPRLDRSRSYTPQHAPLASGRAARHRQPPAVTRPPPSPPADITTHVRVRSRRNGTIGARRLFMCEGGRRRNHGLQLEQGCSDALAAVLHQPQGAPDGDAGQPCRGTRQRRPAGRQRRRSPANEQCPPKGGTGENGSGGSGAQGRSVQKRRCAKRGGGYR